MVQRLKRWESPRRQGRNDKGKSGSARQRQLKKKTQMLRKKLKESQNTDKANKPNQNGGRDIQSLPLFFTPPPRISDSHYRVLSRLTRKTAYHVPVLPMLD